MQNDQKRPIISKLGKFEDAFIFHISSLNAQIWVFRSKNYQLSNILTKFVCTLFQGADFKSDISFRQFQAKIPKFGHFGPKVLPL